MKAYRVTFNDNKNCIILNTTINKIEELYGEDLISIELIKEDIIYFENQSLTTPNQLINFACSLFNVNKRYIMQPHRIKKAIEIRKAIYYICYHKLDMGYTEIAQVFKKDHTTIMNALRNVANKKYINQLLHAYEDQQAK